MTGVPTAVDARGVVRDFHLQPTSSSFGRRPAIEPTGRSPPARAAAAAASGEAWESTTWTRTACRRPAPGSPAAAAARERKDAEAEQCSICLTRRGLRLRPCGCGGVRPCARRFWEKPCPICRKKVKAMQKVFKS